MVMGLCDAHKKNLNLQAHYNCISQSFVTVLAKTRLVRPKTEFNFIATVYRHT